ncbi:hypothetical protein [Aquimarina sp. AU119]|uniref:hypothetical protein n=1 Tax=Aquimarina sp. AU119 TaxID=2108528 RepID=UPI000D68AF96|nr:hypothetical protein [Aquimarina sp. AU119]
MRIVFLIIGCVILFSSCESNKEKREKNTYQIVSLLIDEVGGPIKPPPPPEGQKAYFTNKQIDSIMTRSQDIALHPVFKKVKRKFVKKDNYGEKFNVLLEQLNKLKEEKLIDTLKIKTSISCRLNTIDTLLLKSDKRYIDKNYDILIYFSNISFDDDFSKAVLILSSTRGYLSGSSSIIFLEKKDGIWQIKETDTFSIS